MMLPLSEVVQVVVVTGSGFAALLAPVEAGCVDDTAVQHRAGHECCKDPKIQNSANITNM